MKPSVIRKTAVRAITQDTIALNLSKPYKKTSGDPTMKRKHHLAHLRKR